MDNEIECSTDKNCVNTILTIPRSDRIETTSPDNPSDENEIVISMNTLHDRVHDYHHEGGHGHGDGDGDGDGDGHGHGHGHGHGDGDYDNRSINSYGNINEPNDVLNVKKVKHFKLKKFKSHIDYCKTTRNVTLLKYHDLALIINVIQISVIIVSTAITFFETIRDEANISDDSQRLITVSLSTYIAIVVAISRFLKFDEKKEQFSKLSEKWNQIINKMRGMQHEVESLDSYNLSPGEMKTRIYGILDPKYRENISVIDNDTDNLLNMNEKTYYRNMLMNMRLDDQILDRHDTLFCVYKRLQNTLGFDSNIDKYRQNCIPFMSGRCYISKHDAFFSDMEKICSSVSNNTSSSQHFVSKLADYNGRDDDSILSIARDDNRVVGEGNIKNIGGCIKEAQQERNKYHMI